MAEWLIGRLNRDLEHFRNAVFVVALLLRVVVVCLRTALLGRFREISQLSTERYAEVADMLPARAGRGHRWLR